MKAPWPGTPGGYVPVIWESMIRAATIEAKRKAAQKKQVFYSNVKDAQAAARKGIK